LFGAHNVAGREAPHGDPAQVNVPGPVGLRLSRWPPGAPLRVLRDGRPGPKGSGLRQGRFAIRGAEFFLRQRLLE